MSAREPGVRARAERPRALHRGSQELEPLLFGLSLSKALVVVTLAFFLFGLPLMTFIVILVDRHERKSRKNG